MCHDPKFRNRRRVQINSRCDRNAELLDGKSTNLFFGVPVFRIAGRACGERTNERTNERMGAGDSSPGISGLLDI